MKTTNKKILFLICILQCLGSQVSAQDGNNPWHECAMGNKGPRRCISENHPDASLMHNQNNQGDSPAHLAAASGNVAFIKWLISKTPSNKLLASISQKNVAEQTPLYLAVQHGHLNVVKILCAAGALSRDNSSKEQNTLLHAAIIYNTKIDILSYLLDHNLDINSSGQEQSTPLHMAAFYGRPEMFSLLIRRGADINAVMANGDTALHIAVRENFADMVETLLSLGASADIENLADQRPLDIAIEQDQQQIIELLNNALKYEEILSPMRLEESFSNPEELIQPASPGYLGLITRWFQSGARTRKTPLDYAKNKRVKIFQSNSYTKKILEDNVKQSVKTTQRKKKKSPTEKHAGATELALEKLRLAKMNSWNGDLSVWIIEAKLTWRERKAIEQIPCEQILKELEVPELEVPDDELNFGESDSDSDEEEYN